MTDLVRLRAGDLSVDLAPAVGGAIAAFRHGDADILRPMPAEALARGLVRQSASFPLVPYSNRIAHGRFGANGEAHQLTLNFGDHPHAIHGNGWQRSWTVTRADTTSATLVLDHAPFGFGPGGWDGWPYRYLATQVFDLTSESLSLSLAIENRDALPMPVGLGWHPYFDRRGGATLGFRAGGVWLNGPDSLPRERVTVPPDWDFATARDLGEPALDNCFCDWDGQAEIGLPGHGLLVRLGAGDGLSHAVVFVPKGRDYFAFEPVTNMNDAVNRPDIPGNGLRTLAPGEAMAVEMTLQVTRARP